MLPAARIVVVDDNRDDLQAIVLGLQALGSVALGLHYPEMELQRCPAVRILFLDLHLLPAKDTPEQIRNTIGVLAQLLVCDQGPYAVVLWSDHAEHWEEFENECRARLAQEHLPLPLKVLPLSKVDHLQTMEERRSVTDPQSLKVRVLESIESIPQLAALLAWEEQVSQAADDTIRQIFQIASKHSDPKVRLKEILGDIAVASSSPVVAKQDTYRAANEILVPVLADRLLHRGGGEKLKELWEKAVPEELVSRSTLGEMDRAALNGLLHFQFGSPACQPWERGSVVCFSSSSEIAFKGVWGYSPAEVFEQQDLPQGVRPQLENWVMVQVQAPCDYAQQHRGLLPYVGGMRIAQPSRSWRDGLRKKPHLWLSPAFEENGAIWQFLLNFRFTAGITAKSLGELSWAVPYRIREQLLSELSHALHSYNGRPGIIQFSL